MTHNFNEAEKQPSDREIKELIKKHNEPIKLSVGANIAKTCFPKTKHSIQNSIRRTRKRILDEWGVTLPPVRIQDDTTLNQDEFVLSVYGSEVGRFTMPPSSFLCVDIREIPEPDEEILVGIKTKEPLLGLPAIIVGAEYVDEAKKSGYAVLDFSNVFKAFYRENLVPHLYEFVDIEMTEKMLDRLGKKDSPSAQGASAGRRKH